MTEPAHTYDGVWGFSIAVDDKSIIDSWRGIGWSEDLRTDADIARYLVALYSSVQQKNREQQPAETGGRCVLCRTPLTLYCTACRLPSQPPPPLDSSSQQAPPPQRYPSQQAPPPQGYPSQQAPPPQGYPSQQAPPPQGSPLQQAPPPPVYPSQQAPPPQRSPSQQASPPQGSSSAPSAAAADDTDSEEGDVGAVDIDADSAETPECRLDGEGPAMNRTRSGTVDKSGTGSSVFVSRKAGVLVAAERQMRAPSEGEREGAQTFRTAREPCKIGLNKNRKRKKSSSANESRTGNSLEKTVVRQGLNSARDEAVGDAHDMKQQSQRSVKVRKTNPIRSGRDRSRASKPHPKARSQTQTASKLKLANTLARNMPDRSKNNPLTKPRNDGMSQSTRQAPHPAHKARRLVVPANRDSGARGDPTRKAEDPSPKSKGRPRSMLVSGKYLGALKKLNGQAQFFSRFECAHCHEIFDRKSDFNKHVSTHYHGKPHICIKCGEGFVAVSDLKEHKRGAHSKLNKPPRFTCDECPAEFKTEGRFHLHKKLHEENKLFACKTCGFVATGKKGLDSHRLSHRKAAWVQCEYCGETKRVNNMQRHILMHRGEKPYECAQCDAAFRTPFDLKDHVKRRHSEVKPFSCEICGKGFICSDNLKHHLLVHSGQKPHKCSLCPSSFSRRDYLTKHVRTHTGEKPYQCGDCEEAFAYPNSLKLHRKQCHGGGGASNNNNNACDSKTRREERVTAVKREDNDSFTRREDSGPAVNHQYHSMGSEGQGFGFLPGGIWLPTFSASELG